MQNEQKYTVVRDATNNKSNGPCRSMLIKPYDVKKKVPIRNVAHYYSEDDNHGARV